MNPLYKIYVNDRLMWAKTPYDQRYPSNLSKKYTKDSDEWYYRESLEGQLTFVDSDFDFISNEEIDTKFELVIHHSNNNGGSYDENYFVGYFYKTDCEFDLDHRIVRVDVQTDDPYDEILSHMDDEYNIIDLIPQTVSFPYLRRPIIQFYQLGENSITNVVGGAYWDEKCSIISTQETIVNDLHFYPAAASLNIYYRIVIADAVSPDVDDLYEYPDNDLWDNQPAYKYVKPGQELGSVISNYYSGSYTPTRWGNMLNSTTRWYIEPTSSNGQYVPFLRTQWGENNSIWIQLNDAYFNVDTKYSWGVYQWCGYTIQDVIQALLDKMPTDIKHDQITDSTLLYLSTFNPNRPFPYIKLIITQKSNITRGVFDHPATIGNISLRDVLDMLRKCFRAYWHIVDGRLRIEHVSYYIDGYMYTWEAVGSEMGEVVGHDITQLRNSDNTKWDYNKNVYSYDKEDLPQRYEFKWMDDSSECFAGKPIEILSNYVNKGQIETINISNFSSDIDLMNCRPNDFSNDGWAIIALNNQVSDVWLVDNVTIDGRTFKVQNPWLSLASLPLYYYIYDLPSKNANINGEVIEAKGVRKTKLQTVTLPMNVDPDARQHIVTGLGEGTPDNISINLSSRLATIELRQNTI